MTGLPPDALNQHSRAQVEQAALLRAELPSGYRPAAWCHNCHAPNPTDALQCRDCGYPTGIRAVPGDFLLQALALLGLGTITVYKAGVVIEQRHFSLVPAPFDWRWD